MRRTTFPTSLAAVSLAAFCLLSAPPLAARIFFDDFESGDVSAWSSAVGIPPAPTVYRFSDLDLRDPHVFVSLIGCNDFTNSPGTSFNGLLAEAITTDGDGDGLLDLSALVMFRPYEPDAAGARLDVQAGACTEPLAATACQRAPGMPPAVSTYDAVGAGVCLSPVAGTTSGYSPAIAEPAAPCFTGAPATVTLALLGAEVSLADAQIAAEWGVDEPPSTLTTGLLRGFLSEADADALTLPPELPVVGGQPLSVLLPGGQGSCAMGDDRDVHGGVTGWWLYLNFTAAPPADYIGL